MITRIVIENFKSLRKVDLSLGRMNLFIGANASGKSNFLDALRVLEGIGNGFTIREILDGKPRSSTSESWEGIRGGSAHACFTSADGIDEITIRVCGRYEEPSPLKWKYDIVFSPQGEGKVIREYIDTGEFEYPPSNLSLAKILGRLDRQPALGNIVDGVDLDKASETINIIVEPRCRLARSLSNAQQIDPALSKLRGYSQYNQAFRMGNYGENFSALIKTICQEEQTKDAYLTWLRQLRQEEIEDVGTWSGAVGEPMFMLLENGREFPAPVLSDGTLRFAAIAAAFFQPDMPNLMTIEEIENGIHASRVQRLLELMRSQAEHHQTQVVATTHSATVLDWLQEEDYKTTFLCRRDESTGESRICSLAEVPHFVEVVKKKPASELFSEGWLEMAP